MADEYKLAFQAPQGLTVAPPVPAETVIADNVAVGAAGKAASALPNGAHTTLFLRTSAATNITIRISSKTTAGDYYDSIIKQFGAAGSETVALPGPAKYIEVESSQAVTWSIKASTV